MNNEFSYVVKPSGSKGLMLGYFIDAVSMKCSMEKVFLLSEKDLPKMIDFVCSLEDGVLLYSELIELEDGREVEDIKVYGDAERFEKIGGVDGIINRLQDPAFIRDLDNVTTLSLREHYEDRV